ncbi:MAG: YidC/Oxa1 family membrane protein insertase [Tissierellia bacterium]|nr:YidC/Oxa1 family membrane protein insertase [Tissierellia bacterium]
MDFLSNLLGQLFKFIYDTLESTGVNISDVSNLAIALILMSLVYKVITMPLTIQQTKNSQKTAELQPKLDEIKKKYGYDQQILNQKIQEFQKENNMASAGCSGCLLLIVQMVIVFALFNVVREPGKYLFEDPNQINNIAKNFFWIDNLFMADPTGFVFALLNSLTQLAVAYLSQNSATSQTQQAAQTQKMLMYGLPIIFFVFFRTMPAGLVLYWISGNIVEIIIKGSSKLFSRKK